MVHITVGKRRVPRPAGDESVDMALAMAAMVAGMHSRPACRRGWVPSQAPPGTHRGHRATPGDALLQLCRAAELTEGGGSGDGGGGVWR